MDIDLSCFPCFLQQAVIALDTPAADGGRKTEILREVARMVASVGIDQPPAGATTHIHRFIRNQLGCDPFEERKRASNDKARELLPELETRMAQAMDPLDIGVRAALAGNMMDFGIFKEVDLRRELASALGRPILGDGMEGFREGLQGAERIVYLLDNAGEIVFDTLLIKLLSEAGHRVTAVVKGGPVINDATRVDADSVRLPQVCEVVDNGSDSVGTVFCATSEDFQVLVTGADFVVSKGQANFETLIGEPAVQEKDVTFLFQTKCDVVARKVRAPKGSQIILRLPKV